MSAQERPASSGISPSVGYMVMILLCSAGLLSLVYANPSDAPAGSPTTESPPPPPPTAPAPKPSAAPAPAAADDAKLVSEDLLPGAGEPAKTGDTVTVHYVGTLTNGTEFDASRKHGDKGFSFKLGSGQVIKGWDQGVVGMKLGGRRKLTIPPSLGYGARGAGEAIPPNATLQFVVDMMTITPGN